ncbi:hypothetical protein Tco_1003896 [Tanacetum coccineum]|uniref:Uncharacterized protein n=1 Tax=Tanacetum coccineum TaxID=301880 RepID=A0ABQ5FBS9_9ASTR
MIGVTLWNEMATEFNMRAYESREKPVIIAAASCWVTRYDGFNDACHTYIADISDNGDYARCREDSIGDMTYYHDYFNKIANLDDVKPKLF